MVPFGVTAKGWKGIRNSAVFGGSLAVSETFIRDLLGDDVSRDEYLLSLGIGSVFGAGFKGTLEGLELTLNKINKNQTLDLNKVLTTDESIPPEIPTTRVLGLLEAESQ